MAHLEELLIDDIRDIYDAEKQAVKTYPRLARFASSQELKQAMNMHLEQTKNQVARIEKCFELLGQKARSKPCRAMKGLVEEAMEHAQEHDKGSELDTVLIGALQKMEHYEIAAYGTARALAKSAGHRDAAELLNQTIKEEGETDKILTKIALGIQKEMLQEERQASQQSSAAGRGAKKKVAAGQRSGNQSSSLKSSSGNNGSKSASGQSAGTKVTSDHDEIREWAEARGAHPACVRGTGGKGDTGMIRLDFPGYTGADSLQEISWDDFFQKFDEQGLALLYQDKTARGQKSNFNKIIARETAALTSQGGGGAARRSRGR